MCLASAVGMVGGEGLFRLVCLLGLVSFRPRRFLGARGHPGIVFGRATPRRDAGRLAAQPLRHVGEVLPRGFAGARRQHNAGKTQQHRFETRRGTIHHRLIVKVLWRLRCAIMAEMRCNMMFLVRVQKAARTKS